MHDTAMQDGPRQEQPDGAERDPLSNDDIPAAFWDSVPESDSNADLLAIKALQEESTPAERAQTLKEQGNGLLKRGMQLRKKFFCQQAVEKYSEAVSLLPDEEATVKANLLSNRAQAHLKLANNRAALNDALAALKLQEGNIKAIFRAAHAAAALQELDQAFELCSQGLSLDPHDKDFQRLQQSIEKKQQAAEEATAKAEASRAPARRLVQEILSRGWRIGAPQFSVGDKKPYLDEQGAVHWPLVIIYPASGGRDAVEDVHEENSIQEIVELMFGAGAPPLEWDTEGAYTPERVELYYIRHAATPLSQEKLAEALHSGWPLGLEERELKKYGKQAAKPVRVENSVTLGNLLQAEDCVVPGVPTFFVVAKGTAFRDQFRNEFA